MSYSGLFYDDTKAQAKPRIVCVEEDWDFICHVFPEPGFRSYFCGHIISKLASELKQHGVTDYFERSRRTELTDVPRFLSNIVLIREESDSDDRRRVGGTREEDTRREGESSDTKKPAVGKVEESKVVHSTD